MKPLTSELQRACRIIIFAVPTPLFPHEFFDRCNKWSKTKDRRTHSYSCQFFKVVIGADTIYEVVL